MRYTFRYAKETLEKKGYEYVFKREGMTYDVYTYQHVVKHDYLELWTLRSLGEENTQVNVMDRLGRNIEIENLPDTNRDASGSGGSYDNDVR